jgi:PPOX class probable F420-dependent enzyme
MSIITPELRALIDSGPLAHVVTINPDGSPQVTVVWIALDGDDLVSGHMSRYRKLRNVERDPRISISIEAPSQPGVAMADYAVLYGTATVETGGAPEVLQRLGRVYVGPEFDFPLGPDPAPGYVLRTRVGRVTGHGPWAAGQT